MTELQHPDGSSVAGYCIRSPADGANMLPLLLTPVWSLQQQLTGWVENYNLGI